MRILVALDGSDCSNAALDFVCLRPWAVEDEFKVLSVIEPIPLDFGLGYTPPIVGTDEQLYKDCLRIAERGEDKIRAAHPDNLIESHVLEGFVAGTICELADKWSADLIVLGSHGRKGFQHFLLGSVAETVLKQAPCSVEIVKTKESKLKPAKTEKKQTAKTAK